MQALIAGGMDAAWSEQRDQLAERRADRHYHPNPGGLYEVALKEYGQVAFPLAYQGKLIKVMLWGLDGLAVNPEGYRVIMMRRDPEEIRQSFEAFFGKPCRHPWLVEYETRLVRAEALIRNRLDVRSQATVDYRSLVANPAAAFRALAAEGWPIDAAKAAAVIDPAQCRYRLENLTVGI